MAIRVNILAKELGIGNRELITLCQDEGLVRIRTHSHSLSEGEEKLIRERFAARKRAAATPPRPAPAQRPATPVTAPPAPAAPPPRAAAPAAPSRASATPPQAPAQPAAPSRPAAPAQPPAVSRPAAPPRPAPTPRPVAPPRPGAPSGPPRRPPARPGARPAGPRPGRPETTRPAEARPERGVTRRVDRHRPKEREAPAEDDAEAKARRATLRPREDEPKGKDLGMLFTDFTVGGTYSGVMADAGIDYQHRVRRPRPYGRRKRYQTAAARTAPVEVPPAERKALLSFPVTVRNLSAAIGVKASELIAQLMANGLTVTINNPLPNDVVQMIALEHGWEVKIKEHENIEDEIERAATADSGENLRPRNPVVTMLGHVDHGKTSLLDRIRKANVAATESGGITQHVGAYSVEMPDGKRITFLDTPGHEAFTAMRARGANCTDIVVLVVAADDGVMPQTQEAISHARAAKAPIVVALNKIDLPAADPKRVKPQLGGAGLELEEWGGDVPCVEVSAVTGQGIEQLLEMILLVAELRELKANPGKSATGVVLEAHITEGRGPIATVLVRDGTLHVGDVVLCGSAFGRIRAMHDDRARTVEAAEPSTAVQLSGLSGIPEAGDQLLVLDDLQKARQVAEVRSRRTRAASLIERTHVTLETLFGTLEKGEAAEVRVILKVDVAGSLEVLREKLNGLSTDEVHITLIHTGVGAVNESDVLLADASDAIIIAYRVVADVRARRLAEEKRVDLRFYQIIFQPVDDMRSALSGLLKPERRETIIGHANVLKVFKISRIGTVAGCQVADGTIANDAKVRVARDGIVILDNARIASLRRIKEDIRQTVSGTECGIRIADYDDVKEGDIIEAYRVEEIARTL